MTEKMRKILTAVLALVFVVSTALVIDHQIDAEAAEDSYAQAQQIAAQTGEKMPGSETAPVTEPPLVTEPPVEETVPVETESQTVWVPAQVEPDEHMQKLTEINLEALRAENPDVVGWIFLPNSKVNYPIVQGEDNQFYLKHTWDKKESSSGSIFLEAGNTADFSDFRSILYGHNMANMSMFAVLHYYAGIWYLQAFPYVYLVTDEGVLRYEIYSTYNAEVESKTFALDLDDRVKASFIQMTLDESQVDTGIVPAVTDRLLTLSTCTGNYETRRVVHARLVMEEVEIKNDSPQE